MAETIYDGPPSVGELERSLVEVAAQRDQLEQQVRELLEAVAKQPAAHALYSALNALDRTGPQDEGGSQ